MSPIHALRAGLVQAVRAPRLLLVLWLASVLVAVPFTLLLGQALARSMGGGLAEDHLRDGFDTSWYAEWTADARGLETTFSPALIGVGAPLSNLDELWSGRIFTSQPGLVALGVAYGLLWAFLLGGVLDYLRFSGPLSSHGEGVGGEDSSARRFEAGRFFSAAGRTFAAFVAIVAVTGVGYLGLFLLASKAFHAIEQATRDVTDERAIFAAYLGAALVLVAGLAVLRLISDYAKIAVVRDQRARPLPAVLSSLRDALVFVARRPLATLGLFAAFAVLGGVLVLVYGVIAPGAGTSSWLGIVGAFGVGQLYLVAKLLLRVALLGAETRLRASEVG